MAPSSPRSGFTRPSRWVRPVTQRSPRRPRPREKAVRRSIPRSQRASRETCHGISSLMQDLLGLAATLRVGGAMIYPLLALAVVAAVVALEKGFVFASRTRLPASLLTVAEARGEL